MAYKNLIGAGLRTWLNVGVLSFVFVVILLMNGLIQGWSEQAIEESIAWEYAHGHLKHKDYDPLDYFSIEDGHGTFEGAEESGLEPVLVRQATIYPQGRVKPINIKGIRSNQKIVDLPTGILDSIEAQVPALIGTRMAEMSDLKEGDQVLLRWRDKNGTYDATDITIARIFNTNIASVDQSLVWIPIDRLWEMTELDDQASYYIAPKGYDHQPTSNWRFEDQDDLLREFRELIKMESISSAIMYGILLIIALIAIFDTQVLSVFRRQREIGTYVALGMTRMEVLRLFTIEGAMYSVFGVLVGCLWGIPLLLWLGHTGISFPEFYEDMGVNMPSTLYPPFSLRSIILTALILVVSATIVSLLPARKIARMDPVNALKGKMI